MLRLSNSAHTPFKVIVSLPRSFPCAAALLVALTAATLMPERAWPADLGLLPKPDAQQEKPVVKQEKPAAQPETPAARQKRLFEEFLRLRQKQK